MGRICLITPGQPSINPRLVKEADALAEVGHQVHVLCSHVVPWADAFDKKLLSARNWTCSYVGGSRGSFLYAWTRLRYRLARKFCASGNWVCARALTRVTPELLVAAERCSADLYIAHYTGALAAAAQAAKKNGARVAFDAEDFESGYYEKSSGPQPIDLLIEAVERKYLAECCYVSAASPGIAVAYEEKYGISRPTTILNVFSAAEQPRQFRRTVPGHPMRLYWFSQTIGPGRGLEDVIRAMGKLRDCHIELHLRGTTRPEHWRYFQGLIIENQLLPQRVVLHAPAAPDEMIRAAAAFDVGLALEQPVSVNREVCLTNKIFSYLLAGNAVAATDTSGQRPILERIGESGFLYTPGDVDALAYGLRHWYQNREQLESARQQAWAFGTHPFNWDVEKEKFLELVGGVLEGREEYAKAAS
jgi:glycosyltransferase involved in cell wall biosynthesis